MLKKTLFTTFFLVLFIFIGLIWGQFNSPAYASEKCTGGEIARDDRILTITLSNAQPPLGSSFVMTVAGRGSKDDGSYSAYIVATKNTKNALDRQVVWRSDDSFRLDDGKSKKITIDTDDISPKAAAGDQYILRVLKVGRKPYCGQVWVYVPGGAGEDTGTCFFSLPSRTARTGNEVVLTIKNTVVNDEYRIYVADSNNDEVDKKTQIAIASTLETPFAFTKAGWYHFHVDHQSKKTRCVAGKYGSIKISGDPVDIEFNPITSFSDIRDILTGEKFESVGALITALVPSIFSIAAMLALLFLIWGGIRYMTARGDPKAMDAARGTITSAIIGLIIVLLAGVIYTLIAAVFKIDIFATLVPAAYAQSEPKDIGCVLKLGGECISTVFPSFGALFTNIVIFALAAAALIFFVMLLWGGFRYLNAGGDPKNAEAARQTLTSAAVGLLIVVVSLVIIEVITRIAGVGSIFLQ